MRRIHYLTFRQLVDDTMALVARVPADVCAVAGVPRSGMGPASLIATTLHLPLFAATRQGLIDLGHGRRLERADTSTGRYLIVDDSAFRGVSLAAAATATGLPRQRLITAVVYALPRSAALAHGGIDMIQRIVAFPRFFEWNLLNHRMASHMMCDIDGVICRDPAAPDDDSDDYAAALHSAAPYHLPRRRKIHTLVTHRLERWRELTCAWLKQYDVQFAELVMAPQTTAAQRRAEMRPYGRWKGSLYRRSPCRLFVESSRAQAIEIHRTSGKPVLCIENGAVYQ